MKFLILSENSRGEYLHFHYRNPAANELRQQIELAGHQAIILEWVRHWNKNDLIQAIDIYFKDEKEPVIAVSSTFDLENNDLIYLKDIFVYAKNKYPNLKIIRGGNRIFNPDKKGLVDIHFLGRSMGIFKDWLAGKDITNYIVGNDPLVLVNKKIDVGIDVPLTPNFYKDDCLSKFDHLGFEISIGCRFNCSFCNYELRNSKIVQLTSVKKLKDFFNKAYNEYGIKHFYSIDDTLNESIEKLDILEEAIQNLNYVPNITAWMRADLLHKPEQRRAIKNIQFDSIWFGIESFNSNVTKHIRKKSSMDHIFDSLTFVRDESSNTFTAGSFILGLNGDNFESIEKGFDRVVKEKLLSSLQIYNLSLSPISTAQDNYMISDIEADPEKFGYKVRHKTFDYTYSTNHIVWESDWTNNIETNKMVEYFYNKYKDQILFLTHSECASFRAMGLLKNRQVADSIKLKHNATTLANLYKQHYITHKKQVLGIS